MRRTRVGGLWIVAALLIAGVGPAPAAQASSPADAALADYIVTSWTTKDGLPSNVIWSLAQDAEGYLWLGTNGGLVRFDGVRFITWDAVGGTPLPKAPVRSLLAARDGSLWLGFSQAGGISRIHGNQVRTFTARDGLGRSVVNVLTEDRDGTIYAGCATGLFAFTSDRWTRVGVDHGLPETRIDSAYVDRAGNLLVGSSVGIFRRPAKGDRFELVDSVDDAPTFRGFSEDRDGRVWVSDPLVGFRLLGASRVTRPATQKARGNRVLHDSRGDLWLATMGEGIWRVRTDAATRTQRVEKARVLGARSIIEDREGSIWTGAGDGLVCLRKPRVMPVTDLGLVAGVESTPDGSLWVSTVDELFRFSTDGARVASVGDGVIGSPIRALRSDDAGSLWVATDHALFRVADGRASPIPWPAAVAPHRIVAVASDGSGGVWISDRDRGLFHLHGDGGRLDTLEHPVDTVSVNAMFAGRDGRFWFASSAGRLVAISPDGRTRTFGPEDGLGAGPYNVIYEDRRRNLWVGGSENLSRLVGERFLSLNRFNRFRGGIIGIAEDDDDDLWLATGAGIVHISRRELDVPTADPAREVRATVFDAADGLAGMPVSFGGNDTVARARDGRIWFVTGRGLSVVSPSSLKVRRAPAPVKIETVLADDRPLSLGANPALPARTARVEFDYSLLALNSGPSARFRYRLGGFDAEWIDAGSRRQALYTHLPAGSYTFQVMAANSDGTWAEPGAAWSFVIRPMFYQTWWFYVLCLAAAGLTTYGAWRLRVRRMRHQFAVLLGERVRLSRELHDTLLQSLVGVALQFDAVSKTVEPSSPAARQLIAIRKQVEQYIREARQSIWNLRSPVLNAHDLAAALQASGERATARKPIQFAMSVSGIPTRCEPVVEEQLLRIGQEAIVNATRHADPRTVSVELRYAPDSVSLRVADDGRGFDPRAPSADAAAHYGLISMRERAEQVGGSLIVSSGANAGTVVEASVPNTSVR